MSTDFDKGRSMFDDELLAELPPPREDEPPLLRQDIFDELSDHLECAVRRELLKGSDRATAEQRVLIMFGDPRKLARRLWWQAMWSRMMVQRILAGLQWLLTLSAVGVAIAVLWQQATLLDEIKTARKEQQAEQQAMLVTLNRLLPTQSPAVNEPQPDARHHLIPEWNEDLPPSPFSRPRYLPLTEPDGDESANRTLRPEPSDNPASPDADDRQLTQSAAQELIVTLVQETIDGPQVKAANLQIQFPASNQWLDATKNQAGQFVFAIPNPDRYQLDIALADGQHCRQPILVRGNEKRELKIVCPKPREKTMVLMTAPPLPESLRDKCYLEVVIDDGITTIDGIEWIASKVESQQLTFDSAGGPPIRILDLNSNSVSDFQQTRPEDRVVVLLQGRAKLKYNMHYRPAPSQLRIFSDSPIQTHNFETSDTHLELEIPDQLMMEVYAAVLPGEQKVSLEAQGTRRTRASSHGRRRRDLPDDDSPTSTEGTPKKAEEESLGDQSMLVMTLASGAKGGPVPKTSDISLLDEAGKGAFARLDSGDELLTNLEPDEQGQIRTPKIDPGRYTLSIHLKTGQHLTQRLPLLLPGQKREEVIVCPILGPKVPVLISAPPVPEDLRDKEVKLKAQLIAAPLILEGRTWQSHKNKNLLSFDPETGLLAVLNQIDLRIDAAEERLLVLPAGSYTLRLWIEFNQRTFSVEPPFTLEAKPGDNKWQLLVPEGDWKQVRDSIAESRKNDTGA